MMQTLNISISEVEYKKFRIPSNRLNFDDFIEIVSKYLIRDNLNRTIELAEKYGLSSMTMEEITNEVKAVRKHAKTCH